MHISKWRWSGFLFSGLLIAGIYSFAQMGGGAGGGTTGSSGGIGTPSNPGGGTQSNPAGTPNRGPTGIPEPANPSQSSGETNQPATPPERVGPAGSTTNPAAGRSDRDISSEIRTGIMNDPTLSEDSRGVHILTNNGKVTLTGSVATDGDRERIENRAATVVGRENVTDQMKVENR